MEKLEFYKMQLDAVGEAARRARWVILIGTIVSIIQMAAAYNFGWGNVRPFMEELAVPKLQSAASGPSAASAASAPPAASPGSAPPAASETSADPHKYYLQALRKQMINNWVDSLFVNVAIFGIKFSVFDVNVIGAISLIVVAIWIVYCQRRENHMIASIVKITNQSDDKELRRYVFYGLCSTQVFATVTFDDEPFDSLSSLVESRRPKKILPLRFLLLILVFLPAVSYAFVIVTDFANHFILIELFHGINCTELDILSKSCQDSINSIPSTSPTEVISMLFVLAGEVMVGGIISVLLYHAHRYQNATAKLLRELKMKGWGDDLNT